MGKPLLAFRQSMAAMAREMADHPRPGNDTSDSGLADLLRVRARRRYGGELPWVAPGGGEPWVAPVGGTVLVRFFGDFLVKKDQFMGNVRTAG